MMTKKIKKEKRLCLMCDECGSWVVDKQPLPNRLTGCPVCRWIEVDEAEDDVLVKLDDIKKNGCEACEGLKKEIRFEEEVKRLCDKVASGGLGEIRGLTTAIRIISGKKN